MKLHGVKLIVVSMCLVIGMSSGMTRVEARELEEVSAQRVCLSPAAVKLTREMDKQWVDHVVWTRLYIVSALSNLDDKQQVLDRLLRNQQDIGDAFKPYYGDVAGNKIAELLREHIVLAGQIVEAAKSGNQSQVEQLNKKWMSNADDIAKYWSSLNPNYSYKKLQEMMQQHLKFIGDDLSARLKKDWNASVVAFDQGLNHMIMLADILSAGIVKQFPDRFR